MTPHLRIRTGNPHAGSYAPTRHPATTCSMSDTPANIAPWLRSLSSAAARSMNDSTSSGTLRMILEGGGAAGRPRERFYL